MTPEDITTTVDIDFHAVQLDIPIEQMAAMADRWKENDRKKVTVWIMRLPSAGKAFLLDEGAIYVQTKLGETTLTVRDCDSEGNQKTFSPIQAALNAGRQEKQQKIKAAAQAFYAQKQMQPSHSTWNSPNTTSDGNSSMGISGTSNGSLRK